MKEYMALSAGAVSILGSSNTADYAIRSQISGTNNVLKGQENNLSTFNTVSGYGNEGTNISRSTIVGTRNNLKNGEDNVVIGGFPITLMVESIMLYLAPWQLRSEM